MAYYNEQGEFVMSIEETEEFSRQCKELSIATKFDIEEVRITVKKVIAEFNETETNETQE